MRASFTLLSRRRYRSMMAVSKGTPLSRGIWKRDVAGGRGEVAVVVTAAVALTSLAALIFDLISVKAVAAKCVVFFIDIHSYIKYTVHRGLPLYAVTPVALPSIVSIQANPRPYNGEVTSYYLFSKISISADHNAPDFSEAGIESIRFRSGISK